MKQSVGFEGCRCEASATRGMLGASGAETGTQLIRRPERAESSDDGIRFPWDEGVLRMRDSMRKGAKNLRG